MTYQLSYATVKLIDKHLAEVIVDHGIEISLEMIEELEDFLNQTFRQPFALLVNKLNKYTYSFEAMIAMASHPLLAAMAVVNYDDVSRDPLQQVLQIRAVDDLNIEFFSGLEFGWQQAKVWLEEQILQVNA